MTNPKLEEHRRGVAGDAGVVEAHSGKLIDLTDPKADQVDINDVAHALAHICRFGGQCSSFYSVAEHSVLVAAFVSSQVDADEIGGRTLIKAALLHDAHEAYLLDVPTPLKNLLDPAYAELTEKMDRAVGEHFSVRPELFNHRLVKGADDAAVSWEGCLLMPGKAWDWTREATKGQEQPHIVGYSPDNAKLQFLQAAREVGIDT